MRSLCLCLLALLLGAVPGVSDGQPESARIYVRRVEFQGSEGIADHVMRRELAQLEGTYLNTEALEQSRRQLARLPYIEAVRTLLRPITGTINQVDVVMEITQGPARFYGGGGAYSESQRVSVHGFFTNENLFGTGQRFSATANVSELRSLAEVSHTNPYINPARVSRTLSVAAQRLDRLTADATHLDADLLTARLEYGYRTGPNHTVALGIALNDVDLATDSIVSDQLLDWMQRNGNPAVTGSTTSTDFRFIEFRLRWRQDSRNRPVFADRGLAQQLEFRSALFGSEVEYFAIDYALTKHWPLTGQWEARWDAKLGYGASYGSDTSSLPPHLNWFSGGPDSVRGYREGSLGPRDSLLNPYGGDLAISSQFELMTPLPEKLRTRMRFGFFYDFGNAFSTGNVVFTDAMGESLDYGFDSSRLRQSIGLSARVSMPFGLIRVSYGVPLDADENHPNPYFRDDTERFQIAIGVDF